MSHQKKHDKDRPAGQEQTPPGAQEAAGPQAEQSGQSPPPLPSEALKAERDDLLARLQRVSADYMNYQKRVQRDIAQAREFANEELIKALLPVLDDMERALKAGQQNHGADDPLLVGMELVRKNALGTLERFGLTPIHAEQEIFDPEHHLALMQQASDRHPPRTVLQELQKGYKLKGRILRPAHVIVSKEPEGSEAGREPTDSGEECKD